MSNQIIIAMDMEIPEGMILISKLRQSEKIYGYKIGSLWILERGVEILKSVRDMLDEIKSSQKIILDMQKWGTDIPDIIKKQVDKVAPYIDELICCPMGAGRESLNAFAKTCIENYIKPICVLEMTHPFSSSYLDKESSTEILKDAYYLGIRDFVIPSTKITNVQYAFYYHNKVINKKNINLYATGFKVQGGQVKSMVDFGVTKFIIGRAIYEAENSLQETENVYKEINEA